MADLPVRPEPTSPRRPSRAARRHPNREPVGRAYVGVAEAAAYLGLSEKTIRRLIARGR